MKRFEMSRRELLKALGGGILVLVAGPTALAQGGESGRGGQREGAAQTIDAWIHIAPDGTITVFSGKVEVGQNARTSITQAAAEELRVPVESIKVVLGDTDLVPFDAGTFGSRTTPQMIPQIRRAAAAARERLLDLASEKWKRPKTAMTVAVGVVTAGAARATYGELAKDQAFDKPIPADVPLTPLADWKVLGTSVQKVGARDIVTGKHRYSIDQRKPGMLYAKVLRPPSYGATLASVDSSAAESMAGVKVVRQGDFVAVAAPTLRLAEKALNTIKADWTEKSGQPASKDQVKTLRPEAGSAGATYSCAYIAHVPLEPRAAFAEWDGKKMTVHTGTQRPFGVKAEVVEATNLPEAQVRVIVPDSGSGYGGKHSGDAAVEAAKIAKALGAAVSLSWTRQEEFMWAYFRPGGVIDVSAKAGADGKLTKWEFDNYNSGGSGLRTPYEVAAKEQTHRSNTPLKQGSYRGLAATFNNFARESYMDELAHKLGLDPVEFRLRNLKDERMIAVLKAAAEKFGWGPGSKTAIGIACGSEKGSYVATATEVSIDAQTKAIRVVRAVTAYECGKILNPELLQSQVDGAVVQGLGGALWEEIEYADGRLMTDRLSRYRVPRYGDIPAIETVLLDRPDIASVGAGETPIICIAPAIGNAVFMATGQRLRSMPLRLS